MGLNSGRLRGQNFDLGETDRQSLPCFLSSQAGTTHRPGPGNIGNACHPVESRRSQEILELKFHKIGEGGGSELS